MTSLRQISVQSETLFPFVGMASRGSRKHRSQAKVNAAFSLPEIPINQPICKATAQIGTDTHNYDPPAATFLGSLGVYHSQIKLWAPGF